MSDFKVEQWQLEQRRNLSLEVKIELSKKRIRDWYEYWDGNVFVSFSGGKDSTVLLWLARQVYEDIPAVFYNTGLEYPEIVKFVKTFDNIEIRRPSMTFGSVLKKYGYPVISKRVARFVNDIQKGKNNQKTKKLRLTGYSSGGKYLPSMKLPKKWMFLVDGPCILSDKCCDIMKKNPAKLYEKETGRKPIIGTLAEESNMRKQEYMRIGCNAYSLKHPKSQPLSFWTNQDILKCIKKYNIPYCSIYGDIIEVDGKLKFTGEQRTGCIFCMFGIMYDEDRFERLAETHPKLYYYCMNKLGLATILNYIGNKNYQVVGKLEL